MDFRSLQQFLHLAGSLHYGRSSEAMHMSPSTLSRSISRLEDELGVTLFERDNRSVRLTPAGRVFSDFAEQCLTEWRKVRQTLSHAPGEVTGCLQLYCSVTASYSLVAPLLSAFRETYPAVEINLKTGDAAFAIEHVMSREADVVIAPRPDHLSPQLAFCSLQKTPLVLIAPTVNSPVKQLLDEPGFSWQDVPMILPRHGLSRRRLEAWFSQKSIKPRVFAEVEGHEAIVSMVALGMGVGVVPGLVIDNSPMADKISVVNAGLNLEPYDVGLVALDKRLAEPLVRLFWETSASIVD